MFSTPTWEISLNIKVNGKYEVKNGTYFVSGEYLLITEWKGSIEKDNSDFLLYYGSHKIIKWEGKEFIHSLKNLFKKTIDISKHPSPKLKVNYLLRKNDLINLDFNFSSIQIPFYKIDKTYIKKMLIMPCSAQNEFLNPKIKYNRNLIKGSNNICFEYCKIQNKKFEKTYSWEWRRVETYYEKNRVFPFLNFHSVILKLKIEPLNNN
ncbi:hypothetical protein NLD30_08265 [SCandidatus Aminicenantes bacterium Aminicenantia_JdfR_composite]|nr:hypothetical protein [SCandidatus Aminicenantes bacterium Aminicenantia_JdfR_composite]MCP2605525.1 hypothetical protein [Candidatus Aminicenantes bacterium AC-335-O07]